MVTPYTRPAQADPSQALQLRQQRQQQQHQQLQGMRQDADRLSQRHQRAQELEQSLRQGLREVDPEQFHSPQDREMVQSYLTEAESAIDELIEEGDITHVDEDLQRIAGRLSQDLEPVMQSQQRYEQAIQELQESDQAPEVKDFFARRMQEQRRQGVLQDDIETGRVRDTFQPAQPPEYIDVLNIAEEFADGIEKQVRQQGGLPPELANIPGLRGIREDVVRSPDVIRMATAQRMLNDSKARQQLQLEVEARGLDPYEASELQAINPNTGSKRTIQEPSDATDNEQVMEVSNLQKYTEEKIQPIVDQKTVRETTYSNIGDIPNHSATYRGFEDSIEDSNNWMPGSIEIEDYDPFHMKESYEEYVNNLRHSKQEFDKVINKIYESADKYNEGQVGFTIKKEGEKEFKALSKEEVKESLDKGEGVLPTLQVWRTNSEGNRVPVSDEDVEKEISEVRNLFEFLNQQQTKHREFLQDAVENIHTSDLEDYIGPDQLKELDRNIKRTLNQSLDRNPDRDSLRNILREAVENSIEFTGGGEGGRVTKGYDDRPSPRKTMTAPKKSPEDITDDLMVDLEKEYENKWGDYFKDSDQTVRGWPVMKPVDLPEFDKQVDTYVDTAVLPGGEAVESADGTLIEDEDVINQLTTENKTGHWIAHTPEDGYKLLLEYEVEEDMGMYGTNNEKQLVKLPLNDQLRKTAIETGGMSSIGAELNQEISQQRKQGLTSGDISITPRQVENYAKRIQHKNPRKARAALSYAQQMDSPIGTRWRLLDGEERRRLEEKDEEVYPYAVEVIRQGGGTDEEYVGDIPAFAATQFEEALEEIMHGQ